MDGDREGIRDRSRSGAHDNRKDFYMSFDIDFTGDTPETMDVSRADPGWYRARCVKQKFNVERRAQELHFQITGPTFKGCLHIESLMDPANASTENAFRVFVNKAKSFSKRLGVVTDADAGKKVSPSWDKAIGAEVVLNLVDGSYEKEGKRHQKVECDWAPYPLDHDKIPPAVRIRLGLELLPGQSMEAPAPQANTPKKSSAGKNQSPPTDRPPAEITPEQIAAMGL